VVDSDAVAALALRIEERLDDLPTHLDASLTGTSIVFTRTLDAIIRGQATSVVMALGIIYLILAAMFVSVRIGFIALIPNVLPVVVYFGALGWMGIRLDPGMSLIAPMVLGIAVDDTIHYFARFIREAKRLGDEDRATVSALRSVGRPVTYTSAALCLGFLMLNLSELRSNAQLGSMAAFAMAFAWLTDFTLTPALCVKLRIATLWDFLRLDLGRDPQRSIALFEGMRAGQARMVALMATLMEVRAGQRLFSVGEPGDALYVVIQGRLTAHIGQDDSTTELAVHRRGGVLGEVGLFREQRIANVDVVEDAKLLRLTQESVAQLARQRPKTAALVFRNLNGLLAQRIAKLTDREVLDSAGPAEQTLDREALASQADALEQSFFTAEAEALRDRLRGLGSDASAEAGAVSSQIAYLGIDPDTLAALTLLPLVEVAWADGEMDDGEKRAVLTAATTAGIEPGSASYGMLELWLEEPPKPDLRAAWVDYIRAICSELSVEGRMRLQSVIIGMARNVAEAAGGFLGFGSVSRSEERVLAELESAFQDS
jgi:CRP-like cAMP-binding protein